MIHYANKAKNAEGDEMTASPFSVPHSLGTAGAGPRFHQHYPASFPGVSAALQ